MRERHPWLVALLTAAGVCTLVPGGLALFGPPQFLEAAARLGDRLLVVSWALLFTLSAGFFRLLLRKPDPAEEAVLPEKKPSVPPAVKDGPYLR